MLFSKFPKLKSSLEKSFQKSPIEKFLRDSSFGASSDTLSRADFMQRNHLIELKCVKQILYYLQPKKLALETDWYLSVWLKNG